MSLRRDQFVVGDSYHCYNRGIDKRVAFLDTADYHRFLELLYLANSVEPLRRADLGLDKLEEALRYPRDEALVSLGAFCLLPGHFHLALREVREGGITSFMRKVGTAYTLYYNARHKREGNLFLKPFQSRLVSEQHYPALLHFIHSSPTALYEPKWRSGHVVDPQFVSEHLVAYPYSSLRDHLGLSSPLGPLIGRNTESAARTTPIEAMLHAARQYAAEAFPTHEGVV